MLVTEDEREQPLIGFHVTKQLTKGHEDTTKNSNAIGKSFQICQKTNSVFVSAA